MVKIEPFAVEQWMDTYETTPGVLNISETCAASVSIQDLLDLARTNDDGKQGKNDDHWASLNPSPFLTSTKLTYGPIRGSEELRQCIATLHDAGAGAGTKPEAGTGTSRATASAPPPPPLAAQNVLVTPGAIFANFLVFYTLIGPGDHVICVYPTYQQLYSVPESLGAEVSLWRLKEEEGYVPNLGDLESLVKDNTKMIVINNPNNPTGAVIPTALLQDIVAFARSRNIIVLSDEVYSPLFHSLTLPPTSTSTSTSTSTTTAAAEAEAEAAAAATATPPPSILALSPDYTRLIATGSMSKSFSLAGIRLGWIASRDASVIERLASARDYTTISVSQLDDAVARLALGGAVRPALVGRNMALARRNLELLDEFVEGFSGFCEWVRPRAGTTAFIRFLSSAAAADVDAAQGEQGEQGGAEGQRRGQRGQRQPVDDEKFCLDVLRETKVMLVPGRKCFGGGRDFKGFVRIGYVCETEVLVEALVRLGGFVRKNLLGE